MDYDTCQVSFLDLLIIKDNNNLVTDLYRKPKVKNTILRGQSFHPTCLKKSLPISQFKRIHRICIYNEMYEKQCQDLCWRFYERGYANNSIGEAVAQFENIDQKECLSRTHVKLANNRLCCIIQYSALSNEFAHTVRKLACSKFGSCYEPLL